LLSLDTKSQNRWYLKTNESLGLFLTSLLYASFMILFPWDLINKIGFFDDFRTYVVNLEERILDPRSIIERYKITTFLAYFTFEGLWDQILVGLMELTDRNSELSLRLISFSIFFIWGLITFKVIPFWWAIIFLINPTSVDVAMSGLRNGLAYALFFLSLFYFKGVFRHLLFFATPFIHSTAIVLIGLHYGLKIWYGHTLFSSKRFLFSKKVGSIFIAVVPGLLVGLVIAFISEYILSAIGDRRAGMTQRSYDPSQLQALFWYVLLATQLTCSSEYLKKNSLQINLISWFLSMNLVISWSSRVWAASIPLIAIAIWKLPKRKRDFILVLWVSYLIIWYLYWSNLFFWWNQ
jgi:hypothetical protein